VDQAIYREIDDMERGATRKLLGMKFALYETEPMPAGLGTNSIIHVIRIPEKSWEQLHLYLRVTAAASTVADTLDLYVDSMIDDVHWYNLVHFNQLKGNMVVPLKNLVVSQMGSGSYANVSGNIAAGVPPANWCGNALRLRATFVNDSTLAQFSFGVYGSIH
jgi:hypothetical protein